jgi:hypothetical protein
MSEPSPGNPSTPEDAAPPDSQAVSGAPDKSTQSAGIKPPWLQAGLGITSPEPSEVSRQPDTATSLDLLQAYKANAELESYQQDTKERKTYARGFFILSCVWIVVICGLLALQGFGSCGKLQFKLSEPVILAAIGSTTVNILGILYIVANYLFPKRGTADRS